MRQLINGYQPPLDERRIAALSSVFYNANIRNLAEELDRHSPCADIVWTMMPVFAELIRLVEYLAVVGYFYQTLVAKCCSNAYVSDIDDLIEDRFGPLVSEFFGTIGNIAAHNKEASK